MKNILLPTDFSENSWNAISYASQLVKNENCTFYLLNTYKLVVYGTEYAVPNPSRIELTETIKNASKNGLEKISQRFEKELSNPKHKIKSVSSFGTLTGAMEDLDKEHGMDLIVMGTKGATGAMKVLFGSNTVDVLNNSKCPVLAIPDEFKFEVPREILFPSDYSIAFDEKHVKPILEIAKEYQSTIHSLHVYNERRLSEEQLDNRNLLEEILEDIAFEIHNVEDQKIPEAVEKFQSENNIDLLVMINNKHTFFENLFFKNKINEIGFQLAIPFLVIPS
ncbi:universal stress protein [Brumimicrobium glaciale]|uniref:Universal stress protein n=1 Tax=Brumimicrobium glaciale TaxID=200475 RepID=A0A4Q4KM31_9FLAO|nr:universal stress protein [Brumimicrobium glaciale]RYM34030.1 universal stress protein [Brumimicrobium glaciale]